MFKIKLIDTHCHLNMMVKKKFDTPLTEFELDAVGTIVKEAHNHHVETIITVGTSMIENSNCIEIAKRYNHVYATIGLHPNDCTEHWQKDLETIKNLLKNKKENNIVGIGECGMDYHWPNFNAQRQKDVFKAQIELALETDLALVIHTRDASTDTLKILQEYKNNNLRGVLHCFTEDQSYADEITDLGLLLGIGGIITYPKNDQLRELVKTIDLKHIVLETDAPWLPPQSARGKQNNPKYIDEIAHYIAKLRNTSFEEIAEQTTANAQQLFNLS